jgi:hypothetical protein
VSGSRRRPAQRPKLIEVEGHKLTPAMHAAYERHLESRASQHPSAKRALALGLEDFLAHYRPSHKIKDQLADIFKNVTTTGVAIGAMSEYTFYPTNPSSVRTAGCDLLKQLASELCHASARLAAIADAVKAESATKLQDWVAHDEALKRIGSPHA